MESKNKRSLIARAPIRKPQPPDAVSVSDALDFAEGRGSAHQHHAPTDVPQPSRVTEPPQAISPAAQAQTPEEEAARVARIGRTPEGDVRLSVNIARPLHTRLKILSARTGITAGELLERWIRENTPEE